jgi:hypothetical protein
MHGERAAKVRDLILSVTIVVVIISASRFSTLRTNVMGVAIHLDSQLHMRAACRQPDNVSSTWLRIT